MMIINRLNNNINSSMPNNNNNNNCSPEYYILFLFSSSFPQLIYFESMIGVLICHFLSFFSFCSFFNNKKRKRLFIIFSLLFFSIWQSATRTVPDSIQRPDYADHPTGRRMLFVFLYNITSCKVLF